MVRQNLVTAGRFERYFMHVAGIVLFDTNMNYVRRHGQVNADDVIKRAGLEKAYRDIKD